MTVELAALLIGLTTVLFCSCIYTTILHDQRKTILDFMMIEMLRLEINAGNVLVTEISTGDTFFCDANEYYDNKSKYILSDGFQVLDVKDEEEDGE